MKRCLECKIDYEENASYCEKCGASLVNSEKSAKKTTPVNKKKATLFVAIALLLVGAFVVVWKMNHINGIMVDGKFYKFSAENGIDNYEKINDGIVSKSGLNSIYCPIGNEEFQSAPIEKSSTTYVVFGQDCCRNEKYKIDTFHFYFGKNYKTTDGVSDNTSEKEIKDKGYLYRNPGYSQFFTNEGKLNWKDIEKDYDNAKNNMENLDYYDALEASRWLYEGDKARFDSEKDETIYQMAQAKLIESFTKGEIEYFYEQRYFPDRNEIFIYVYGDHFDGVKNGDWHNIWMQED